jgi:hypothetical protein
VPAFAFSWVCEILAFGLLDLDFVIGVLPAIFGPALGAYVVIRTCDGSAGVHAWMRRLLLWRVDWRLYLFALGALPGLVIAAYVLLPEGAQKLGDAGIAAPASYLSLVVIMSLHTGVGEGLGWRGFALPRLQAPQRSDRRVRADRGGLSALAPAVVCALGRLRQRGNGCRERRIHVRHLHGRSDDRTVRHPNLALQPSNGSVLLAVLTHGAANASFAFLPTTWLPTAVAFTSVGLLALVLAGATHGRLGPPLDQGEARQHRDP